jgi:type 1 glutamine amidotransferase
MTGSNTRPRALIAQGGWPGHRPAEVAEILAVGARASGMDVLVEDTLAPLSDAERLAGLALVVVNWHMGVLDEQEKLDLTPLRDAVAAGTGLAGLHAGMGDAFRLDVEYQFMCGGQWVAHPGDDGVTYDVRITDRDSPITKGVNDFTVTTEKYYMHVDPAIHVLATTDFDGVAMPIAWTKPWGMGRVFYCSLGHEPRIMAMPEVERLMRQGMAWAARVNH